MRMLCDMMAGFTIRVPFVHCTDSLQDDETLLDPNPRPRELRAPTEDVHLQTGSLSRPKAHSTNASIPTSGLDLDTGWPPYTQLLTVPAHRLQAVIYQGKTYVIEDDGETRGAGMLGTGSSGEAAIRV